ncbi:hypothetical protein VTJ04DRAFT_6822 [Mycothermus thermophilus]|uniref:uncharacterized protein n=1 Tax=Humicola insolens TaxID=85995 RepID=UPI0037447EBD
MPSSMRKIVGPLPAARQLASTCRRLVPPPPPPPPKSQLLPPLLPPPKREGSTLPPFAPPLASVVCGPPSAAVCGPPAVMLTGSAVCWPVASTALLAATPASLLQAKILGASLVEKVLAAPEERDEKV